MLKLADINECAVNNGECSHICTNFEGSYQCSCGEGLQLEADNRTCGGEGIAAG